MHPGRDPFQTLIARDYTLSEEQVLALATLFYESYPQPGKTLWLSYALIRLLTEKIAELGYSFSLGIPSILVFRMRG